MASFQIEGEHYYADLSHIRLTYEGKVMFEQMENHIEIFQRALRQAYSDHPLGGCLYVIVY